MKKLTLLWIVLASAAMMGQTTVSGTATISGSATVGALNQGPPLPTITVFTASNNSPTQGTPVTLTYAATSAASCTINNGILNFTFICSGTTSPFNPPFSAPGPTCTTYTFTATNAAGQVQSNQVICVSAVVVSGDDSRYSTGIAENCAYPGGVTTDGPATLPTKCPYTLLSAMPHAGTVYAVGCTTSNCSGGAFSSGNCTLAKWQSTVASVNADGNSAGDTIKIAQGCQITCPSTGCLLPNVTGDWSHWTFIESVDPATGNLPSGFPAEGARLTPCDAGVASIASRPDYSTDCTARGGPVDRVATFVSTSTTAAALTVYQIGAVTETCNVTLFPCASFMRLIGIEATNQVGTRTSHKLIELSGADHIILDRSYVHGQIDPLNRVEVQGGVLINGSSESVINSWIDQIVCANAPVGTSCVDSNGIFWSAGQYPEVAHKIVNNFIAASGETVFTGGAGTGYFPTSTNPDGGASDDEIRRNQFYHPPNWFLAFELPTFAITSVDSSGNYSGTFLGCASNACVGKTEKILGFVNAGNNTNAAGILVTASTNSLLSFGTTTTPETHAATAANIEPHWDTKNLGESKGSNRELWEGNVAEYSTAGFQTDQRAFAFLATPKSQDKVNQQVGKTFTGSVSGGLNFIDATGSAFVCDEDPNAIPDWTGAGTTVSSCGIMVAFSCAAGTPQIGPFTLTSVNSSGVFTGTLTGGAANAYAGWGMIVTGFTNAANGSNLSPNTIFITASTATTLSTGETTVTESGVTAKALAISNPSCPGSYAKACSTKGDNNRCAVVSPAAQTGTFYHILSVVSPTRVQVVENATALVAGAANVIGRGANPFAAQRNAVYRYNIIRHVGQCFQFASAQGDWGTNAKGVHEVSAHDNECYDANTPFFYNAANGCCNAGAALELLSGTTDPTVVPSNISYFHNTNPVIGYQSSSASGLTYFVDTRCSPPYNGAIGKCSAGNSPAYTANLTIRDNISAAALHLTGNGSNFTPNDLLNTAYIYGCTNPVAPGSTGCTFNLQKNLQLTGLWTGQTNSPPNLHLLGTNTVEACSCTTVANGGTCTPGSPNTWSSPVVSGGLDACDRNPISGYASIFNNWDPTGGAMLDLQLPSNSPYKSAGSDGLDLGANISTVTTYTTGVAFPTPIVQIAINGYAGHTSCNDLSVCVLPAGTHSTTYGIMLSATSPNGPYAQWTVVSGALPPGLTLSNTGIISGTLTVTTGTYPFSAKKEDVLHSIDIQAFSLTVN